MPDDVMNELESELEESIEQREPVKKKAPAKKRTKAAAKRAAPAAVPVKKTTRAADKDNLTATRAILRAEKTIKIMIASTDRDKHDVFTAINGHNYKIQRNEWVEVPMSIFLNLENAVEKRVRLSEVSQGKAIKTEYYNAPRFSISTRT